MRIDVCISIKFCECSNHADCDAIISCTNPGTASHPIVACSPKMYHWREQINKIRLYYMKRPWVYDLSTSYFFAVWGSALISTNRKDIDWWVCPAWTSSKFSLFGKVLAANQTPRGAPTLEFTLLICCISKLQTRSKCREIQWFQVVQIWEGLIRIQTNEPMCVRDSPQGVLELLTWMEHCLRFWDSFNSTQMESCPSACENTVFNASNKSKLIWIIMYLSKINIH